MNSIKHNVWRLQQVALAVVATVLINALLFAALPWLSRVADRERNRKTVTPYLLSPRRPPKMPESEKEKRLRKEELKLAPRPERQSRTAKGQLNKPMFGFEFGEGGFGDDMAVAMIDIDAGAFGLDMDGFGFDLSQVDKAPRAIRRVPPLYPYRAAIRGIRAKVMIKCLVDKKGMPQKIVAAECDPEDALDVFGPPAVAAVKKWRFSPGEIGGDPVPTRVAFNIIFELDS